MRPFALATFLAAILGCTPQTPPRPPLTDRFYYPTGIFHVPSADGPDGILYVASFNLDKRYDEGTLLAVDLSRVFAGGLVTDYDGGFSDAGPVVVGLPPLGAPVGPYGPLDVQSLSIADAGWVWIQSFAGELTGFNLPDGGLRLFVPSRAEGDYLQVVEANADRLSCFGTSDGDPNCILSSPSLTSLVPPGDAGIVQANSKPRAPQPFGVGISPAGQLFVTHIAPADDPINSATNLDAYLVELSALQPFAAGAPFLDQTAFHSLSVNALYSGPSNSVAVGKRFAYITGRFITPIGATLRTFDQQTQNVNEVGFEADFATLEARGVALSADESRLYIATRSPDALLVAAISDPQDALGAYRVHIERSVPLPEGPNEIQIISRAAIGMGDLVVITCTSANTVVVYDANLGQLVADFPSVGSQPFGVTVDNRGAAARLYVSDFGESRVAVIDMPDLSLPQQSNLVARLGLADVCFVDPTNPSCPPIGPGTGFP
jgi:DNA-binding beta-propeller fold protein YncE